MADKGKNPHDPKLLPPGAEELPPLPEHSSAPAGAEVEFDNNDGELDHGAPEVSGGGTKNIMVLAGIVVVALIVLFNIFSGNDAPKEVDIDQEGSGDSVADSRQLGLPVPPPVTNIVPLPPEPPPPPPRRRAQSDSDGRDAGPRAPVISSNRIKAVSVISNSSTVGTLLEGGSGSAVDRADYPKSQAVQVDATRAGQPDSMIAQGKIIDAVLETAVNTDLSGNLRAVVSRDIYAESGKRVLIPKGSRLVGSYDSNVKRGQTRVFIIWNRVIRPDGIDMAITSPGSDQLGRAGSEGEVDDKYFEIFTNSILLSTVTVAFAYAVESATDTDGLSERENTSGSVTTTGSPSDFAVVDAVENFGSVVKRITNEVVSVKPTITIDQGTRLKVFVNKDIVFPKSVTDRVTVIR